MADDDRDEPEHWRLRHDGARHVLAIASDGVFHRRFRWTIDGEVAAEKRTSDDRFTLVADGRPLALAIRMAQFGDSARRVSLFAADNTAVVHVTAATGIGGIDLDPDPGTRPARRLERMAAHPWRYTAQRTVGAIASVALPILLIWLFSQLLGVLPKPDIDLPEIPVPDIHVDLPDVPLPDIDLPSIDLPALPGWLQRVRDAAQYVVPIAIAFAVARFEVRRRQRAIERRRAPTSGGGGDESRDDRPAPPVDAERASSTDTGSLDAADADPR